MNEIGIEFLDANRSFRPGDRVKCTVRWDLEEIPRAIVVSLVWHTRGIGTEDVGVADSMREESPPARDEHTFEFTAPEYPYTFSGKLISLDWEIEAHRENSRKKAKDSVAETIVIAPDGVEIELG